MKILGIESSCDETAVAIVDDAKNILSHALKSQIDLHKKFGGVVPELAARGHIEVIEELILQALDDANLKLDDIDAIAATSGPGLIGGVIVGLMAAKTLASVLQKPFIAINHLEAHALTVRLSSQVEFPYLLLLFSGGHCQILLAKGVGNYEKFGETIDDAIGECFDKCAQMLGLPYPGGVAIEKLALNGDENKYKFPRPLIDSNQQGKHLFDFSFSGLKTAVRRQIEKISGENFVHNESYKKLTEQEKADICASFQKVIVAIVLNRLENIFEYKTPDVQNIVIAGGVAANRYIFEKLQIFAQKKSLQIITPPIKLCTDNAAMIAWAGVEKMKIGQVNKLDFKPRARWSLEELKEA